MSIPRIEALIVNPWSDIRYVDYKTGLSVRLESTHTFDTGELILTEYKHNDDLVLDVQCTYTRVSHGLLGYRATIRTWYCEDGSAWPDTKVTVKNYTEIMAQRERKMRNQNVIDLIMARARVHGLDTLLTTVFADCSVEITNFLYDNSTALFAKISDPTKYTDLDVEVDPVVIPGVTARMWIQSNLQFVLTEQ